MNIFVRGALIVISLSISFNVFAEAADSNQPIELEADSMIVDDAKSTSTYAGTVILTQGTLVIRANKLVVREDNNGFQHSTATGRPTTFKQKREGKNEYMTGSARRIEYDGRMDKVQLYRNAWVKRGEDIIYGDYISYDANAEYAEVIGGGKSADGSTSNGRVKAIIQPKNKAKPASSPKAKQAPAKPKTPAVINKLRFSNQLKPSPK